MGATLILNMLRSIIKARIIVISLSICEYSSCAFCPPFWFRNAVHQYFEPFVRTTPPPQTVGFTANGRKSLSGFRTSYGEDGLCMGQK